MDDLVVPNRKSFSKSWTDLEKRLFEGPLRTWFKTCARTKVELTKAAADISPDITERQVMKLRTHFGATYRAYGPVTGKQRQFRTAEPLTVAFLVYAEHAWPDGPAFLAAFAMHGTATLVWSHQLAKRFRHLLCTSPFVMAEMRIPSAKELPTSMDFTDLWEVRILGAAERTPERGPNRAA